MGDGGLNEITSSLFQLKNSVSKMKHPNYVSAGIYLCHLEACINLATDLFTFLISTLASWLAVLTRHSEEAEEYIVVK